MSKIFKNLIPYWRWIILIFVFLIAQAYCDLALPAYTSDIIDVGIRIMALMFLQRMYMDMGTELFCIEKNIFNIKAVNGMTKIIWTN